MLRIALVLSGVALLAGCAASGPGSVSNQQQQTCVMELMVFPATGAADHQAKAPGNQVLFGASYGPTAESSCRPPTAVLMSATWASSDPAVQMDSVPGQGNGTATCVGVTNGPATITASYTPLGAATATATASMSCK
jgi:hypothetical protein